MAACSKILRDQLKIETRTDRHIPENTYCLHSVKHHFHFLFSALFRAIINVTSLYYTEEIRAAGRDIGGLAITQQLQAALQSLMTNSLPGVIRIRIVDLQ